MPRRKTKIENDGGGLNDMFDKVKKFAKRAFVSTVSAVTSDCEQTYIKSFKEIADLLNAIEFRQGEIIKQINDQSKSRYPFGPVEGDHAPVYLLFEYCFEVYNFM